MRITLLSAVLVLACAATSIAGQKKTGKSAVLPEGATTAGPYSPGILAGGNLYVAGQIGRDKNGKIPENFEDEVKQALENAGNVLTTAQYSFADAVAVQVYLTDMDLFQRMNAVYTTYFPEPRPARTTVGVAKLVGPARIEITITAYKEKK